MDEVGARWLLRDADKITMIRELRKAATSSAAMRRAASAGADAVRCRLKSATAGGV
ncbi:hypothetical protein GCM10022226_10130 [Sphaerisporangium flaviroseum]|uniref:Deoxyribose-phosphate aldolase n=1 Tax=Sphaerisporangium flaviroseum TaxID=509199 RepID=A0ABP7HIW1_9ACTN